MLIVLGLNISSVTLTLPNTPYSQCLCLLLIILFAFDIETEMSTVLDWVIATHYFMVTMQSYEVGKQRTILRPHSI